MVNKLVLIVISLTLFSCNKSDVQKYYDDSGNLLVEETLVDKKDSIFFSKIYNVKGYLEKEGYSDKKGVGNGQWKFYFSDGHLKWEGKVINGNISIPESILFNANNQISYIEIEGSPKTLKVGQKYKLRTFVKGIPSDYYAVTDSMVSEIENNDVDPEKYPYKFTPKKSGKFEIWIIFPDANGYIIGGESKAKLFTFKVND